MPRYKIFIEYDGSSYCGWQKQPNGNTVEEEIEKALSQVLRQPVDIAGQGRTDSGVHAEGQTAHFDFPEKLDSYQILSAFLGILPHDISVWKIEEVPADFHARFHAKWRRYRYQIVMRPKPLLRSTSEMILGDLDLDEMQKCAERINGTHHFDSFTKPDNETLNSVCEVKRSEFSQNNGLLIYHIEANRFVRHMVRRLVGTMIQVGKGKRTFEEFTDMLHKPDKNKNAHGAAAKGLILEEVIY
ncbi:MAG TPA: tRNA pseudouridine(38-40) synthase TruA [Balneolaceae bacterium]